jgi:EmrB/QacA subfamily drug resistance transporter
LRVRGRQRLILFAACGAAAMTTVDTTVVNVALPSMARDLDASLGTIQWVVVVYTLVFAVLMVPAGRIADLLGHERVWRVGASVFALASLLCAVAPSEELLIGGRVLQGVGAAAMKPTTVAMVASAFGPERRGWALGIMGSTLAAAAALGPVIGSAIVSAVSWRAIFLINLPIAAAAILILRRATRGELTTAPGNVDGLDAAGAVLLGGAMLSIVLALTGTEPAILAPAFAVLLVAFLWRERRAREPIVQLALFRVRAYAVGNVVSVLTSVGFFGMFFLLSLYLQGPLGYSALAGGALLVPLGACTLISSTIGGRLSDRFGSRRPMILGLVLTTAAPLLLSRVGPDSRYVTDVLPAFVLEGLGWGLVSAPLNALVIGAASNRHSGEAAGVMATLDKLGAAVGVALAGGFLAAHGVAGSGAGGASDTGFLVAFDDTMLLAAGAMGLALVLSVFGLRAGVGSASGASRAVGAPAAAGSEPVDEPA